MEIGPGFTKPDFNAEPFRMGGFEQIANYRGGQGGRAEFFKIGLQTKNSDKICGMDIRAGTVCTLSRIFQNQNSQPSMMEWSIESGEYGFRRSPLPETNPAIEFRTPSATIKITGGRFRRFPFDLDYGALVWLIDNALKEEGGFPMNREIVGSIPKKEERVVLLEIIKGVVAMLPRRVYASAPIRSQPHRYLRTCQGYPRSAGRTRSNGSV